MQKAGDRTHSRWKVGRIESRKQSPQKARCRGQIESRSKTQKAEDRTYRRQEVRHAEGGT